MKRYMKAFMDIDSSNERLIKQHSYISFEHSSVMWHKDRVKVLQVDVTSPRFLITVTNNPDNRVYVKEEDMVALRDLLTTMLEDVEEVNN